MDVSVFRHRPREAVTRMNRGVRRSAERARLSPAVPRTWLLSGVPRSGTSLCCRLAGALPDTVTLSEPIRREASSGEMDTPTRSSPSRPSATTSATAVQAPLRSTSRSTSSPCAKSPSATGRPCYEHREAVVVAAARWARRFSDTFVASARWATGTLLRNRLCACWTACCASGESSSARASIPHSSRRSLPRGDAAPRAATITFWASSAASSTGWSCRNALRTPRCESAPGAPVPGRCRFCSTPCWRSAFSTSPKPFPTARGVPAEDPPITSSSR